MIRGRVPHACAGERERLAHRPRDDEVRAPGQQRQRRAEVRPREFRVGLVDDDDATGRVADRFDDLERSAVAGGVVGSAEEDDVRVVLPDGRPRSVRGDHVALTARDLDPPGAGRLGDEGVHRVAGCEAQDGPARPAEGLEDVEQHLVGAVRGPDHAGIDCGVRSALACEDVRQIPGEQGAQAGELPVRIAVERGGDVRDAGLECRGDVRGDRERVLIDIEPDGHVDDGRAVR